MCKEVSKRWKKKCNGLRDVFFRSSWASYIDTRQGDYKCLSEHYAATCSSFPTNISQSACNVHARRCSCHTAKQVKQFLEAKNTEIMKWPAQSPHLNPIENFWKILGDKIMAMKPTSYQTIEESGRRLDQDHTSEKLVIPAAADVLKSFKVRASTLPTNF